MREYRHDIDVVKGLSIIAVVFFHLGLIKSGYLGVDAFFVINGYFLIPSLCNSLVNNNYSYWSFIEKRVLRLLPLIVLASVVCLIIGHIGMLPDDYENLSQTIVASNLFSQNILSTLTVGNYWSAVNDFKPLMHLWYVGILAEFYLIIPLLIKAVVAIADRTKINRRAAILFILFFISAISFVLYVSPWVSSSNKFYLIPCRLFELILGGLLALLMPHVKPFCLKNKTIVLSVFALLIATIFSSLFRPDLAFKGNEPIIVGSDRILDDGLVLPGKILLLFTVLFSVLFVNNYDRKIFNSKFLEWFGKRSYSIFIWHQIILAFIRYYITTDITWWGVLIYLAIVCCVSELSYRFVENRIILSHRSLLIWGIASMICITTAFSIYLKAGVVRDVPELNIRYGEGKRGMFAEYCDRIYSYDKEFPENKRGGVNILVEGVSYGRDFCNVLLESVYIDSINLSYVEQWEKEDYTERIKKADVIFTFRAKHGVPQYVWDAIDNQRVIGLGPKAYGINNGQIYSHRKQVGYYSLTTKAFPECLRLNDEWKNEWGDNYIDFMKYVVVNGENVKVFTPDHRFISQDCRHLTPAGARWYSTIIDLPMFLF